MSIFIEEKNNAATEQLQHYSLEQHVKDLYKRYIASLDGEKPKNVYELFLGEFEKPLLEAVLDYTRHNQSRAAIMMGLSRGTLRKKLKMYGLL